MLIIKITYRFIKSNIKRFLASILIISLSSFSFYFAYAASAKLEEKLYRTTTPLSSNISVEANYNLSESELADFELELKRASSNIKAVSFVHTIMMNSSTRTFYLKSFELNDDFDFYEIKKSYNMSPDTFRDPYNLGEVIDGVIPVYYNFVIAALFEFGKSGHDDEVRYADINVGLNKVYTHKLLDDPLIKYDFKIVGKVYSDVPNRRDRLIYMEPRHLNEVMGITGHTSVEIMLKNPNKSRSDEHKIEKVLDKYLNNYQVNNWLDSGQAVSNLIYIEKISILLIQVLIAFAVSYSLANNMSLLTKDKFREIGILKAMGLKDESVTKIFLLEALVISLISLFIGIGFGYYVNIFFTTKFIHHYRYVPLVDLPTTYFNKYSIVTIVGIFFATLIGSYMPLRKVKRLRIIEVIKE